MSTRTAYDRALSLDEGSAFGFAAVAVIAHLGLGAVLSRHARAAAPEPLATPTEIEFVAATTPPPPPPPVSAPEVREDRAVPTAAAPRVATPHAAAPAKAPPVMTATGPSEGPVSFATDPNGTEYGSGVVSANGAGTIGGSGTHVAAAAPPAPPAPPPPPPPSPPKKFATPPRLQTGNACRGYFPNAADDDAATVALVVTVRADGAVTAANVASESPKGQGFGAAARACILAQRFVPATAEDGSETTATATVNVHFSR